MSCQCDFCNPGCQAKRQRQAAHALYSENRSLKEQVSELQQIIDMQRRKIDALELRDSSSDELRQLKCDLSNAQSTIRGLSQCNEELVDQRRQAQMRIDSLVKEIKELKAKNESSTSTRGWGLFVFVK